MIRKQGGSNQNVLSHQSDENETPDLREENNDDTTVINENLHEEIVTKETPQAGTSNDEEHFKLENNLPFFCDTTEEDFADALEDLLCESLFGETSGTEEVDFAEFENFFPDTNMNEQNRANAEMIFPIYEYGGGASFKEPDECLAFFQDNSNLVLEPESDNEDDILLQYRLDLKEQQSEMKHENELVRGFRYFFDDVKDEIKKTNHLKTSLNNPEMLQTLKKIERKCNIHQLDEKYETTGEEKCPIKTLSILKSRVQEPIALKSILKQPAMKTSIPLKPILKTRTIKKNLTVYPHKGILKKPQTSKIPPKEIIKVEENKTIDVPRKQVTIREPTEEEHIYFNLNLKTPSDTSDEEKEETRPCNKKDSAAGICDGAGNKETPTEEREEEIRKTWQSTGAIPKSSRWRRH